MDLARAYPGEILGLGMSTFLETVVSEMKVVVDYSHYLG
jgi:hypothetical protein